jgi:hypothetical protein
MEIQLEDFDLFVLSEMHNSYKNKLDCNTFEITKKYCQRFENGDSLKYHKCIDMFYQRIRRNVMPKLINYGLVIVTKNGNNRNIYTLILNNIRIKKHKFQRKEFNCIALKIRDKWVIIEN